MQVQHEQAQNELIESLQRQVNELTAEKVLLQEQLARKEQFTAIIAHEIRSPLTPIINYAQIVARPNQRRETIERGTTIIVRAWQTRGLAHISVHNEGVGISAADVDQLFRPYSRLPGSSPRRGSGLGLYIAKCIVEAHGGELRLDQLAGEHQGTTFSFDLP